MASTCALNQEGRDSSPEAQEAFIQFIDIDYVALDLVLNQAIASATPKARAVADVKIGKANVILNLL